MSPEKQPDYPLPPDPATVDFLKQAVEKEFEKHGWTVKISPDTRINSKNEMIKPPTDPSTNADEAR